VSVLFFATAVALIYTYTGRKQMVTIPTSDKSMRPAIEKEEKGKVRFTIDASWLEAPKARQIVAYSPPGSDELTAVRVVALQGEKIEVRERRLHVNGSPRSSPRPMPVATVPEFRCPRDCVYVMSDSARRENVDSAVHGPVPIWRIKGALDL
jgi:signal peptidase I